MIETIEHKEDNVYSYYTVHSLYLNDNHEMDKVRIIKCYCGYDRSVRLKKVIAQMLTE
ncbi:MAG: hypothetical protein RBR32_03745 [Bacteroidales bacterium]|nr:hypothetical protein [Bacteroidales bacterium]